jgi:hypothetical protein
MYKYVHLSTGASPSEWSGTKQQAQQLAATQVITARLATILLAPPSLRHQVRAGGRGQGGKEGGEGMFLCSTIAPKACVAEMCAGIDA